MKFDLHTHNYLCGHANGCIEEYIVSAIEKDFNVIGISDHSPFWGKSEDQFLPNVAMAKSQFDNYVTEVNRLKEKYKDKIKVLLAIESDYFPDEYMIYKKAFKNIHFDYIIGSVHVLEDIEIFNVQRWGNLSENQIVNLKEKYYRLIKEAANSKMFDTIAHIDAIKGNFPLIDSYKFNEEIIDDVLKTLSNNGVAMEINTSGKTKKCGGWYPSFEIIEKAIYYDVKLTFGSDAHHPDRVGDEFDQVKSELRKLKAKEWYYFESRKPVKVTL